MFRLSQLNWPRILFSRSAAVLLGLAAALSVCALALMHSDINLDSLSPLKREALSIAGAASAFGFFPLLICMGFFWLRCDASSKPIRALWFVFLLLGFFYGSQIAYYGIVYLPAVIKRLRDPEGENPTARLPKTEKARRLFGPFGWVLIAGWGLLFLTVVLMFTFPKCMSHLFRPVAEFFVLWPAGLLLGTGVYVIILIFRSGMRRQ